MEVTDAIETRISVREFTDEPVSMGTKRVILEAGRLSQSGHNSQHRQLILVDDPDALQCLAERSTSGAWVSDASFAVTVVTDPDRHYHEIDAGRVVDHMQFAAWDRGVASCIYTGLDESGTRSFLGIPDELAVPVVAGFGYPEFDVEDLEGRKDRAPLEDVAHYGTFGTSFSASE